MKNKEQFSAMLGVAIVPAILENLLDVFDNEKTAIKNFYKSELFDNLQKQETGLWHLSAKTLAEMYKQELSNGYIDYPEEQS